MGRKESNQTNKQKFGEAQNIDAADLHLRFIKDLNNYIGVYNYTMVGNSASGRKRHLGVIVLTILQTDMK